MKGLNTKKELVYIISAAILFVLGTLFEKELHNTAKATGEYIVFLLAYFLSGWRVWSSAGRNMFQGKIFDENFLMVVATIGAILIHELPEAVGVMLFFKVGDFLQDLSVDHSQRSIKSLLEIRPEHANLKIGREIRKVHPGEVNIGETIIVKPGERIPLDGRVLEGDSWVDTSALTGEATPRMVKPGEIVLAGMINKTNVLTIRVTKRFDESSISRILDMVKEATNKKADTEKFITRFAKRYTPIVVLGALLVASVPPLVVGTGFLKWLYRALVLLVISCPCALVISIPLSYFGGIGGASKKGILIKGSNFLDALTHVRTVVFDKTGTLTKGVFKVTRVVPKNGFTKESLLHLAAEAESQSNHPIARSILEAYNKPIEPSVVTRCEEIAGQGIEAKVRNNTVLVGNDHLLHQRNVGHDVCDVGGTCVHIVVDGVYAGYIVIADELKEDAVQTVQMLREIGVETIVMLTGDNEEAAKRVAQKLCLDYYFAGLLPEEKIAVLEKILGESHGDERVVFVGDGINDAPVIARADVGVAMGGLGADVAIETADIVIMTDSPSKVVEAIKMGRKTRRIVWENIGLALTVKGSFIVLGVTGLATMWEAVFADVGVTLIAIFNAVRALR
ncbi:MAG: cadmium-translocating P-type ATPase [Methanobacteriota archaeon]|nr:MAG: cadmium-translocating P-type ATPase [Euryarchaeota archaeon]